MRKHLFIILIIMVSAFAFTSCNDKDKTEDGGKKRLPSVETQPAKNVMSNTVTLVGYISDAGNPPYRNKGFYVEKYDSYAGRWSEFTGISVLGSGTGSFSCDLTGLSPSTDYRYCAKAENEEGWRQGRMMSFTTTGGGINPVITVNGGAEALVIDLENLPVSALVAVTSERANLTFVKVYIQITGDGITPFDLDLETVTVFENAKVWSNAYIFTEEQMAGFIPLLPEGAQLSFNVEAKTADGGEKAVSLPITIEGMLTHPLEGPEDLTWYRLGMITEGLAAFGLRWDGNVKDIHAQIKKEGATKLVLLPIENWNTFTTKEEIAEAIETATDIVVYAGINVTNPKIEAGMNAIGVKYNDVYYMINLAMVTVKVVDAGMEITVTGQYKY